MHRHAADALVRRLAPTVKQRYASWWRSMTGLAARPHAGAGPDVPALLDHPRGLRLALDAVDGPESALGLYLRSLGCADDCRPAHRVFLEDLAEGLLMPPTLVRELNRASLGPRPGALPATAAVAATAGRAALSL